MSRPGWIKGGQNPEAPYSADGPSKAAAKSVAPRIPWTQTIALEAFERAGAVGLTDEEGGDRTGIIRHSFGARRSELEQAHLVRKRGDTRPSRSAEPNAVYVLARSDWRSLVRTSRPAGALTAAGRLRKRIEELEGELAAVRTSLRDEMSRKAEAKPTQMSLLESSSRSTGNPLAMGWARGRK